MTTKWETLSRSAIHTLRNNVIVIKKDAKKFGGICKLAEFSGIRYDVWTNRNWSQKIIKRMKATFGDQVINEKIESISESGNRVTIFYKHSNHVVMIPDQKKTAKNERAQMIKDYTADWLENEHPWRLWQENKNGSWTDLESAPDFLEHRFYRRKPDFVEINGVEIPIPEKTALAFGETYYTITVKQNVWSNADDVKCLDDGLVYKSFDNARKYILAASALIKAPK